LKSIYSSLSNALIKNINKAGIYNQGGHFILVNAVERGGSIIDLGANKGRFYNFMYDNFHSKCYAIEAAPDIFSGLHPVPDAHTYNYAISKENGFIELYLSNEPEANSLQAVIAANWGIASSVTVPSITLEKFITDEEINTPVDVLKIDIEGTELDVINTLPVLLLKQIKQIPVEFHDFLNLSDEYKAGMNEAFKKLRENNFTIIRFSSYDNREVLCINNYLIPLTGHQKLRLKIVHPVLRNLKLFHTAIRRFFK
jgi:FkbM family methyltransferase